ncbi:MYCBP-associated protein [Operophtera brumata]|uniref:MYCBP-associated protein n=1 Tax=Operophtera brumata TaxID=104452 RepID=A0A0L7LHA6_OPEBR|nr:MYCBP-associated protein [Operophtera brumata]
MQRKKNHDITIKEVEPDHESLVWEKWIKIRKSETMKLGLAVDRPPTDLAMNLLENVREEREWKTVLEHAQLDKKPNVRGTLWEQPLRLKQGCYCEPVYEVHRTSADMGKPPVIEHVSVPMHVQVTEKGLTGVTCRIICEELNEGFLKYRNQRETELHKKIKKIDPFRPSAAELIVKGSKPKTPPKKIPPLPNIIITEPVGLSEEDLCNVYAIRINNTVICKDIPGQKLDYLTKMKTENWHETCNSWSYYFNTPIKRAGRCKLYLQNLGTVALRYCWKKIKKPIPFIPEDIYEQVFFFNKNEDVLSPGQSKEVFFTFVSDMPGIYSEYWELSFCNIFFFDTLSDRLSVSLYADSVEDVAGIKQKVDLLKAKIDRKAITNIVSDIINDATTKAVAIEPQKYPYKKLFLEAEIFLMKNPVCFYHQTEVMLMKNLYTEMVPGELWDLSIANWKAKMMEQKYDERMRFYELLKKSHHELLKPWYEGEDLAKQKHRAVKLLISQMADMFDKEYDRLVVIFSSVDTDEEEREPMSHVSIITDPMIKQQIHNLFYIHAFDYVATTIELCAGVLSSLDLNRWVEFDFCQW